MDKIGENPKPILSNSNLVITSQQEKNIYYSYLFIYF